MSGTLNDKVRDKEPTALEVPEVEPACQAEEELEEHEGPEVADGEPTEHAQESTTLEVIKAALEWIVACLTRLILWIGNLFCISAAQSAGPTSGLGDVTSRVGMHTTQPPIY
jgi:hypothetical protein